MKSQSGQTLIETIVAIFVLTTALSAGLALTIYAVSSSKMNFDQIAATNLAREGVDVVRMMRDTNWLEGDVKGAPPWTLSTCADISGKLCYGRAWRGVPGPGGGFHNYDIRADATMRVDYDKASREWTIASNSNYALYLQVDGTYTHTVNGNSNFSRRIIITENTAAPFTNTNSNSELIVQSVVGWKGKGCSAMASADPMTTNCKVIIEEHFTNWKDYK